MPGSSAAAAAAGGLPGPGSGGPGGGALSPPALCGVVSFRELSMLWQRHRKHSQRLVLLLDCAHSGYWVAALRMLSKAEQLELSLGVQVGQGGGGGRRGCAWRVGMGVGRRAGGPDCRWERGAGGADWYWGLQGGFAGTPGLRWQAGKGGCRWAGRRLGGVEAPKQAWGAARAKPLGHSWGQGWPGHAGDWRGGGLGQASVGPRNPFSCWQGAGLGRSGVCMKPLRRSYIGLVRSR